MNSSKQKKVDTPASRANDNLKRALIIMARDLRRTTVSPDGESFADPRLLLSDRATFRKTVLQWRENAPEQLSDEMRGLSLELAMRARMVYYESFLHESLEVAENAQLRSALSDGHGDLVMQYLQLHGLALCLTQGLDALIVDYTGVPTAAELATTQGRKAALAKKEKDPKQRAKAQAKVLWKEWRAGQHPSIRRTEDFATEVMRRWPVLTSAKVIEGWSAVWGKEVKAGPNPASP